jgi:peptidoglycan/xylan/chitin deacetylase (PgdA/CDA1 family)
VRWPVIAACLGVAALAAAAPDPMPPETGSATAKPAPNAMPNPDPAPTPAPAPTPTPILNPKDLTTLTSDPILGRANRVMGEETTGVVAFTFDDGPNPETTPAVIEALVKYDVPATFFIVTQRVAGRHGEKSREVLATELINGFTVGSHSVTHANLKHAAGKQIETEIDGSLRTLAPLANRPIGLFRPPYGALSGAARAHLKKLGMTEVIWSIDTLDWKAKNADRLRKKVAKMIEAQHGGIVLMHDVKPITAGIIANVLDDLEAANCAKLAAHAAPIVPVSIHYFLKDGKTPRQLPDAVRIRTDAYRAALPARCAARPAPPVTPA